MIIFYDVLLNNRLTANIILYYQYADQMLVALNNQQIDGIFEAPFIIDSATIDPGLKSSIQEYPIEIVIGDIYFMFSKQTQTLDFVKKFNQALSRVKQSQKYLSHPYWSKLD